MRHGDHVRHRIHHHTHHGALDVQNDDHGEFVVVGLGQVQLQAQVNDGHNHAAQVDHTFDEARSIHHAGGLFVRTNFLNPQNVNGVLFFAKPQRQKLT